jgi:hypothetical protein
MSDFEIVDPKGIEFVKRGRKAEASPELVKALAGLKQGQTIALKAMTVDPNSQTFQKDKARISSQIRTACKLANLKSWTINWSAQGIPHVTV